MADLVMRWIVQAFGYVFLLIGIAGLLTPIPFGVVFFTLALLLLIPTTPWVTRRVQRLRQRWARLDRMMAGLIRRLPVPYRRILRQTDVDVLDRY
jgi:hypothetical protein